MDGTAAGWVADVKGTGARYALLKPGSKLAYGLQTLEGWKELQRSDTSSCSKPPTTGRRPTSRPGPDMAEPRRSGVRRRGPQA